MSYKIQITLVAALLGLVMGSTAQAVCSVPGNHATPIIVGPPNPNNGFAEYVTETLPPAGTDPGLSLELCLDPAFCFFDPPDPAFVYSTQIGFGFEAFWWLAQPDTTNFPPAQDSIALGGDGTGVGAVLVLGAEAAFLGDIFDGGQFPFTRLRIRVNVNTPGFYRITEPYGIHVYEVINVGDGNEISDSFDVEFTQGTIDAGVVTEATNSTNCVGPWLTWDPAVPPLAPPGFIGDGATPHEITGSPTGTNFFRIEAFSDAAQVVHLDTLDPLDADGDGQNTVQTNLFTVTGKLYDGRLATPMVAERATYTRASGAPSVGQVDVFARGAGTAAVDFTGGPNVNGTFPLLGNLGGFFDSEQLIDATVLPPVVDIDATDTPTDLTHLVQPLVDLVTITRAEYNISVGTLTVEASSSDTLAPPTLRLIDPVQILTAGSVEVTLSATGAPLAPPGVVTVSSSAGGSATRLVEVISDDQDGDGVLDAVDNCPVTFNPGQADGENDGTGDACDNCTLVANGPNTYPPGDPRIQYDSNGDGYGNRCDADFNDDNIVDVLDIPLFRAAFGTSAPNEDLNGDTIVDVLDVPILRALFGLPPGPSCCGPLP